MPKSTVIAEIETDSDEDNRIDIQSTPTPTDSEAEDDVLNMEKIVKGEDMKPKEDRDKKPKGRPKKPLTEARKKQLEAMNEGRKKQYADYKEQQAILFLKDRGFNIDSKKVSRELKSKKKDIAKANEIRLAEVKIPSHSEPKQINTSTPMARQAVTPNVVIAPKPAYKPASQLRKAYNPFSE